MNYLHLIIILGLLYWIYNKNTKFYKSNPFYKYLQKQKIVHIKYYRNICNILNIFFADRKNFKLSYKETLINLNKFLKLYDKIKISNVPKKNNILMLKSIKKEIMLNLHSICYNIKPTKYKKYIKYEHDLLNILNNLINSLYNKNDLNNVKYPIAWNEVTDHKNIYI